MEELFYASGKINVVIGVMTIIMVGLLAYLFFIDRKVTRLEKKINDKSSK